MILVRTKAFLGLAPLAVLLACSGEDEAPLGNPNPNTPPAFKAIPGGGTTGGKIAGALTVFLVDHSDRPVEGALVRAVTSAKTVEGTTNADGRVDLSDEALKAPIALHYFKAGYSFGTAIGFDARAVTVRTAPLTPAVASIGTVTGTVSGWDLLPPITASSGRVAVISALGQDLEDPEQEARPGTATPNNPSGVGSNVCIVGQPPFPRQRDFGLRLDTRATALWALGGTFTPGASPPVSLTHVGVRTTVDAAAAVSRAGNDIALSHALDQDLEIQLTGAAPAGLGEGLATFALQLPGNGPIAPLAIAPLTQGRGRSKGPTLDRAFAGASYLAALSFSSPEQVGGAPAQTVSAIARGTEKNFTVANVITPVGRPTAEGRKLTVTPSPSADFHSYDLLRADGIVVWEVAILGGGGEVTLPSVPEGLADPLTGTITVEVSAADTGDADLNAIEFRTLGTKVTASSSARAELTF